MSERVWHVSIDGETYGPYTASELNKIANSGRLRPSDHIWREGMQEWQRADSLDGLFKATSPPQAPPSPIPATYEHSGTAYARTPDHGTWGKNSKPVFSDLFTPSGRRNRKSFSYFGLAALSLIVASLTIAFAVGQANQSPLPVILALIVVVIPTFCSAIFVSAQRLRDFGWPGAAALLFVVPALGQLLNIALLVIPGTVGPNRYGDDPTQE